jgi:hypothetical protein
VPDSDFRNRVSSNFSSNIVSESGSTDFVEGLVKLQTEVAGDDFLLDLGGAAEDEDTLIAAHRALAEDLVHYLRALGAEGGNDTP